MDEIQNKILEKKPYSVPGPNNIPYIILKHLGPNSLTILQKIFNNILSSGNILQDWKAGTIYPIPKTKEWMGDLNITRPITLLNTTRKFFTSILNCRITHLCSKYPI